MENQESKALNFYYLELGLLAAIWGSSFLFLRVAAPDFGPLPLIFIRTFIAAIVLLPLIYINKQFKILFKHWLLFLWLGATTVAVPFSLFAYVTLHVTAGNTSILNATTSMFSAIIAWLWLQEKLSARAMIGLLVGFFGVAVLSFGKNAVSGGSNSTDLHIFPVLAALLAACLYAYGSCFARKYLSGFKSITIAAGSQIGSSFLLLPPGLYFWPEKMPNAHSWLSSILLGVFCTALALIMYFNLLKKVGVAKTVSVTYLIPVFGVLWGVLFLAEPLTSSMFVGGALVLLGVALTAKKRSLSK